MTRRDRLMSFFRALRPRNGNRLTNLQTPRNSLVTEFHSQKGGGAHMSRDRNFTTSYLALTCAGFATVLAPAAAVAQETPVAAAAPTQLKGVTVTDTAI